MKYSKKELLWFLDELEIVYDEPEINYGQLQFGFQVEKNKKFILSTRTSIADHVHVFIAGTNDSEDKIINTLVNKVPLPWANKEDDIKAHVHYGFLLLADLLTRILLEIFGTDCKLTLVGHSLGGAIAGIAGTMLNNEFWNPRVKHFTEVVTFGCPRIGNREYVLHFDEEQHFRIANEGDAVTRLPKSWFGKTDYVHCKAGLKLPAQKKNIFQKFMPSVGHRLEDYRKLIMEDL